MTRPAQVGDWVPETVLDILEATLRERAIPVPPALEPPNFTDTRRSGWSLVRKNDV